MQPVLKRYATEPWTMHANREMHTGHLSNSPRGMARMPTGAGGSGEARRAGALRVR